MAHRKELFQTKVLQKLYPAAPKPEKKPSPPDNVDVLSKKSSVKATQVDSKAGNAGMTQSAANPGRRLYTVLPPPADYKMDTEKSDTMPQQESVNSSKDPAEEITHDSDGESNEDEEGEEQKRKRRRKRKPGNCNSATDGAASVSESSRGQNQTSVSEGGEPISRNKKRKLKKKRHKEKLRSMGLMPRAAALEFTYQKDEEDENIEERAAEVADFFRTTMNIYLSDSLSHLDKLPLLSETINDLLHSIASGDKPTSVLKQLYRLKVLVQQKETDKLEKSLDDLQNASILSEEETTAVISLFQYWITDILPMQADRKTELSTMHS